MASGDVGSAAWRRDGHHQRRPGPSGHCEKSLDLSALLPAAPLWFPTVQTDLETAQVLHEPLRVAGADLAAGDLVEGAEAEAAFQGVQLTLSDDGHIRLEPLASPPTDVLQWSGSGGGGGDSQATEAQWGEQPAGVPGGRKRARGLDVPGEGLDTKRRRQLERNREAQRKFRQRKRATEEHQKGEQEVLKQRVQSLKVQSTVLRRENEILRAIMDMPHVAPATRNPGPPVTKWPCVESKIAA